MTGQESRPGGRSQAASEVLAADTFMVAADAHNFGRGMPVSERRVLARRGMAALKDALPDLVEQLARTPENCDPSNLRAMCQGCHLHYDRDHHAETARATRQAAREESGQSQLNFGEYA